MIGTTIKNLKIISKLGEGGMGVVYLAEHVILKKRFAVKSLSTTLSLEPEFRERFFREAQNQALINHPSIVQATDFFEEGGQYFLVMEYVEGKELGELIKSEGKLSEEKSLAFFEDILEGLSFAHKKGVIHRDMKPSNILIDETGRARITDFGIAILAGGKRMTSAGLAVGTAEYMSPEQIKRPQEIDKRSDIYSAGLVLYEMLTGELPFQGDSEFSIKEQQINSPLPDPRLKNPAISSALVQCIQKATQKDPSKRFQDCAAFLDCLRNCEPSTPAVVPFQPKWWLFAALVSACIAVLTVYAVIHFIIQPYFQEKSEQQRLIDREAANKEAADRAAADRAAADRETAKIHIPNAQKNLSIMCREFKEIQLKRQNLRIAQSIGDTAIIDGYTKRIQEHEENIRRSLSDYNDIMIKLANLNQNIVNQEFDNYINQLAQNDQFNLRPFVDLARRHYQQYLNNKTSVDEDVVRNACP
jgi:serine/threonine protein kinase